MCDFAAAAISWTLFFLFRKIVLEAQVFHHPVAFQLGGMFFAGVVFVPCFWVILYYATGYYNNVLRKTRLEDFGQTFVVTLIGMVVVFFMLILDDYVGSYQRYYQLFVLLFLLHFTLTLIPRLFITASVFKNERKGKIIFKTILIGRVDRLRQIWREMEVRFPGHGHKPLGYIPLDGEMDNLDDLKINKIADFKDIHDVVKQKAPTDIIIALDRTDGESYDRIIYDLNSSNVVVKINPELYPVAQKYVVISSLFNYPLIQVSRDLLPPWQASLKVLVDVIGALTGLLISLPVCLVLVVLIKLTSKGPVIYSHERIGRFGKPFKIYKFRSMYSDAEKEGPQLASTNDSRITPVGRFMRNLKLDEIPNFVNVLKGDMSLVGPRPERRFFIDQIIKQAPDYSRLLKIKPGVTSWGQVKYGYAANVDEMVRRLRYDLLYLENMSLYVDFLIMARTIVTIFKGNGQ
jgi:exopolysaccharide biosynthesis polyprenyl glycosylphosphotransferase